MAVGRLQCQSRKFFPGENGAVGCFSKHLSTNENGERLVKFCENNNLVLCNTLFKHRMQHRSTWFSDGLSHPDGKPVRNMIDFVIARRTDKVKLTNARSYGGFMTRSDHHPVIADFVLTLRKCHQPKRSIDLCFIKYNEPNPSSVKVFNSALMETLPDVPVSCNIQTAEVDSIWTTFVQSCHEAADKAFGKRPLHQRRIASTDPEVIELSKCQQKLHAQLHAENDPSTRQELKAKRNKILHQIRSLLRTRGDQF